MTASWLWSFRKIPPEPSPWWLYGYLGASAGPLRITDLVSNSRDGMRSRQQQGHHGPLGQGRKEQSMSLWERQEVQEVLWGRSLISGTERLIFLENSSSAFSLPGQGTHFRSRSGALPPWNGDRRSRIGGSRRELPGLPGTRQARRRIGSVKWMPFVPQSSNGTSISNSSRAGRNPGWGAGFRMLTANN